MERKSMDSFYDFSDEELEKRKSDFKQKYCIKQELRPNGKIIAFGSKFHDRYGCRPPHADRPTYWKNQDGNLVVRMEPYDTALSLDTRKELEAWCDKYEFECIYDKELLPFHNTDGIEVIILISKIKYRNVKECKKRGWI